MFFFQFFWALKGISEHTKKKGQSREGRKFSPAQRLISFQFDIKRKIIFLFSCSTGCPLEGKGETENIMIAPSDEVVSN